MIQLQSSRLASKANVSKYFNCLLQLSAFELLRKSSEAQVREFVDLYSQHFSLAVGSRERLVAQVHNQQIRTLIEEGQAEEALNMIEEQRDVSCQLLPQSAHLTFTLQAVFDDIKKSFMAVDVLKLATEAGNDALFKRTKQLLIDMLGATSAAVYVGIAYLELRDRRGIDTLTHMDGVPSDLFRPIMWRQAEARRVHVLHTLFTLLNNERAPLDLELLLEETIRQYREYLLNKLLAIHPLLVQ